MSQKIIKCFDVHANIEVQIELLFLLLNINEIIKHIFPVAKFKQIQLFYYNVFFLN